MYYHNYLQLDKILNAQYPESDKIGKPAHDEMLFIVIHQAYELWFKQILFELDFVKNIFKKPAIDDNTSDINLVRHRLDRISKIFDVLNHQIDLLNTMTPLDFMEFRNLLTPASGFQSLQFRLIEASLGLEMKSRHHADYYKRTNEGGFNEEQHSIIEKTETETTVLQLVNSWLERMPFFEKNFWPNFNENNIHPFWEEYKNLYQKALSPNEKEKYLEFEEIFIKNIKPVNVNFSPKALQAALFIMLYRDIPVFQNSFQIIDRLIEIDHQMATWRHKHMVMVRRMIGMRLGTGNTSGQGYLDGATRSHYIFKDLSGLATYIIQRGNLPELPNELKKMSGFNL